jgi:vacuolar-type H+-ATPase subunit F/Vma7
VNHSLRVVCRPSSCDGFALAGVHALGAADPTEAAAVLAALVSQPEPGVVFVDETLYRGLPEPLRESLESRIVPMVIPFTGLRAAAGGSAEIELAEMIRTAIGHRVRLR